ncbi:MAG: hypothetical protein PHT24_05110, partial [Endomicrobiaceae bacterium]|nr:hypothetical protein [Endomicrobiaceae bacterium]
GANESDISVFIITEFLSINDECSIWKLAKTNKLFQTKSRLELKSEDINKLQFSSNSTVRNAKKCTIINSASDTNINLRVCLFDQNLPHCVILDCPNKASLLSSQNEILINLTEISTFVKKNKKQDL